MDCIFCAIVRDQKPERIHFEDDQVMAFDDIHPKAPVHVIVIPKEHIPSIAHLAANHSNVISKLIYTAKRIAAEKGLQGYKLIFNVGRAGGQAIDHLHLHLLGGWGSDEERVRGFVIDRPQHS